jgi:hypothetical protein
MTAAHQILVICVFLAAIGAVVFVISYGFFAGNVLRCVYCGKPIGPDSNRVSNKIDHFHPKCATKQSAEMMARQITNEEE